MECKRILVADKIYLIILLNLEINRKMDNENLPEIKFNIKEDTIELKDLVSKYASDWFLAEIAQLATMEAIPRIQLQPFIGLSSPFRQLAHLGALNVTSQSNKISLNDATHVDNWHEIIKQSIMVRAGYYEEMMPKEDEIDGEYYELYRISLPVFDSYFDTSTVNYEEQEINKIVGLFQPFTDEIFLKTGLYVNEFIDIYNLIDSTLSNIIKDNYDLLARSRNAQKQARINKGLPPREWKYTGNDEEVIKIINYHSDIRVKFTIDLNMINSSYEEYKLLRFFKMFQIERGENLEYLYYSSVNPLLLNPIYKINDGKYLIVFRKHLIHSIYIRLYNIISETPKAEMFFSYRGKWLQNKTVELLRQYFPSKAKIYNEYKVNGKGQDVLLLCNGLALIIENKAHNEVKFSGVPNVKLIFDQYLSRFKKTIQKGYDQCWRVKDQFWFEDSFVITNNRGAFIDNIKTNKYPNVFAIILTLDEFRTPQINTSELLKLHDDDEAYPLSISIDDLEIILLTMKKLKQDQYKFLKYLILRQKMQGLLITNEELEIWGTFIQDSNFSIPQSKDYKFSPSIFSTNVFDKEYITGMGFQNEKYMDLKIKGIFKYLYAFRNRLPVPDLKKIGNLPHKSY